MKYSIITINYNNRDGLRRTIESVVNQTIKPSEIVLTVDGPIPDLLEAVIKKYTEN